MNKALTLSLLLVASFGVTTASAVSLIDVDGDWTGTTGGFNVNFPTGVAVAYGNLSQDQVRWGNPYLPRNANGLQSGLGFTGVVDTSQAAIPIVLDTPFEIGQLVHFNFEQQNNTSATEAFMDLQLGFDDPAGSATVGLTFQIDETLGIGTPDIISFPAGTSQNLTLNGTNYKFTFLGFGDSVATLEEEFVSQEGGTNETLLFGVLSEVPLIPAPGALLLGSLGAGLVGLVRGRKRA